MALRQRILTANGKQIEGGQNSQILILPDLAHIPCLNDPALRGIDVFLVLDLLDTDTHAVFGEDDVLLAHALGGRVADLGDGEVDVPADPSGAGEDDESDEEGNELTGGWSVPGRYLVELVRETYRIVEAMMIVSCADVKRR
jgi:hypothetical protein